MGKTMNSGSYGERFEERVDLRRKRDSALSDRLVRRAHWLEPEDRELVLAMFDRGLSAAAIAQLSRSPVRHVRRRIRQLVERLNDPRVAYVIAHQNSWGHTMRGVGRELFIRGRSMREVSDELGVSLHSVRKHRDAIETMTQAQQRSPRVSRAWLHAERSES